MNALENWFCATRFWRIVTQHKLLPWVISESSLGEHVLELGAGPGAGTAELRRLVPRVTSIEYSHAFAAGLAGRERGAPVVQGDASMLPFVGSSFSAVIAILMLHHLQSHELQIRAFGEIWRVLKPGGVFLAFEIQDGWMQRAIHWHSTFVPVVPAALPTLLSAAGFGQVTIDTGFGGFRVRARKEFEGG